MSAAPVEESWSFSCTACGKCCDSAPRLSVPELLHHEARFIGCLSVRRVPRTLDEPSDELASRIFLPLSALPGQDLFLFTQAAHYESQGRCPELQPDGRCGVHFEQKPLVCSVVPLEATLPESAQRTILSQRARELADVGCLKPSASPGPNELVRHLRVVEPESSRLLAAAQNELVLARRLWVEAVGRFLGPALWSTKESALRLPVAGAFTLSPVPVLAHLAGLSPRLHERVLGYLVAQDTLLQATINAALARKNPRDRAETERLRGFARHGAALAAQLRSSAPTARAALADEVEGWLGL